MSDSQSCWSPAVFLDKAQELKRRLALWHVDNPKEPVLRVTFIEFHNIIRLTFRDIILNSEHGKKPEKGEQIIYGLISEEEKDKEILGHVFYNLPSDNDKSLTQWLLRDFYEHLADAGDGERAKLMKLKVDRILEEPIYCESKSLNDDNQEYLEIKDREENGGPHSFIGGQYVNPVLLDELVLVAEALVSENSDLLRGELSAPEITPQTNKKTKRRGPKGASPETIQREAKLIEDWQQAREAGVCKAEFANDNGMTLKDFGNLIARVKRRKSRSNN